MCHCIRHLIKGRIAIVGIGVASQVIARIVLCPGRAAISGDLGGGLYSFSSCKQAAGRDACRDERTIIRASIERRRFVCQILGSEVIEENLLDRTRAGWSHRPAPSGVVAVINEAHEVGRADHVEVQVEYNGVLEDNHSSSSGGQRIVGFCPEGAGAALHQRNGTGREASKVCGLAAACRTTRGWQIQVYCCHRRRHIAATGLLHRLEIRAVYIGLRGRRNLLENGRSPVRDQQKCELLEVNFISSCHSPVIYILRRGIVPSCGGQSITAIGIREALERGLMFANTRQRHTLAETLAISNIVCHCVGSVGKGCHNDCQHKQYSNRFTEQNILLIGKQFYKWC